MIYAPILIPTLNRYEHLPRCISSLQRNEGAENTELYISVDYPPSHEYEEGYNRICDYLKRGIRGFKKTDIVYHNNNLGSVKNADLMISRLRGRFDRYIFIEDDIEVAPNFLEYMNKGLELFENDERVFSICSTGAAQEQHGDYNVVLSRNFSAWGVGHWFKKDDILKKSLRRE